MNIRMPTFTLEYDPDDVDAPDSLVSLHQDHHDGETPHWVELHPAQLAVITARVGVHAPQAEADRRTIARLSRQLRTLLARINTLDNWLNEVAQQGHEVLDLETSYSLATWELAAEFVRDLPDEPATPVTPPATAPATPATADQPAPEQAALL